MQSGTQNFHGKSKKFYLKIMPFWVTSWLFRKVPYGIVLTCNYDISVVISWWCFCNTWLLYSDKPYCAWYSKTIVPGTTKSSLLFCISSFWSSFFSICDQSEVDINKLFYKNFIFFEEFTGTILQNTQITKIKTGRCFECFWARRKQGNLEVFWSNNFFVTSKGFLNHRFCQRLRINFNKFIRQIRNHLRAFIEETIIIYCSLDGDLSHTTDVVYFSFSMTRDWPSPQDLFFLLIC